MHPFCIKALCPLPFAIQPNLDKICQLHRKYLRYDSKLIRSSRSTGFDRANRHYLSDPLSAALTWKTSLLQELTRLRSWRVVVAKGGAHRIFDNLRRQQHNDLLSSILSAC